MYKHILLATDLVRTGKGVAHRARALASQFGARLSIVYVIEPFSTYGLPLMVDVGTANVKHAKQLMIELGRELQVSAQHQYVETGSPKKEILKLAESLPVDLIIVGDQGRVGLSRLLGSTAMSVLHDSHCDVMLLKAHPENDAAGL